MYFQERICKQGVCFRVKIKFSCSTYSKIATGPILENSFGIFLANTQILDVIVFLTLFVLNINLLRRLQAGIPTFLRVTVLHQVSVRYRKYFVSRIHETKSQQQLKTAAFTSELRVIPA